MKKRILALILALCICLGAPAVLAAEISGKMQYVYLSELANYIVNNYKFETTREELIEEAFFRKLIDPAISFNDMVKYMMDCLDENSMYLYEDELNSMMREDISGTITGIGVTIVNRNGRVVVVSPMKDSPAYKAGIQPNDIIVSVDGVDVSNEDMDTVRSLVIGEKGTPVAVGVLRGESVLTFNIVRDEVRAITVGHQVLEGNIGYIAITSFNKNVVEAVEEALAEFDALGITKIVVDLRYNPGGELQEVVELCRKFVPKGVIATIDYSDASGREDEIYYSENETPKYNLAVLINEGSASASELFTGAVQDTGVGRVFGTTSFGKGTVQEILPIATGGGIRLTIAEYKTAGGRSIHKVGIEPDEYVKNTTQIKDISHFTAIDFSDLCYEAGDNGQGVLAIEQRLEFLGYMKGADEVFDGETALAVQSFQINAGISATGKADLNTLLYISGQDYELPVFVDKQLGAATGYLLSLN
jgi:carboxyl-terminal processing protease